MAKIGGRKTQLPKGSQTELVKQIGTLREDIGKCEWKEALLSVETAKKIVDAFNVTLDYLIDENVKPTFDKLMVRRLQNIEAFGAFFRGTKTKTAYS